MKKAKKELILKSAVKVFAEKGYQLATILEIAKQAGVSKGLVHFYFENKLDLLLSAIIFFMQSVNGINREKLTTVTDPVKKLTLVFETFQELLLKDKKGLYWQNIIKEGVPYTRGDELKKLKHKIEEIEVENRLLLSTVDNIISEGQLKGKIINDFKPEVLRQILGGASQLLFYGLFLKKFKHVDIGYDEEDIQFSLRRLIEIFEVKTKE